MLIDSRGSCQTTDVTRRSPFIYMDRTGDAARLLSNQPYDESLEVDEPEEVVRVYSRRPGRSGGDKADEDLKPLRGHEYRQPEEEEEDDDEDEEEEDSDEEETDDDDEPRRAPEGSYDPANYANLPVSTEIKELFQYITR